MHNMIMTSCALTCCGPINQLTLFRTGAPAGIAGGNPVPSLRPAGVQRTHTHATVAYKYQSCNGDGPAYVCVCTLCN